LTATRVRDAINDVYPAAARIVDGVSIELALPAERDARAAMLANIEMLDVDPAPQRARVIVNSRTGTVVINQAVRLAPAAISHGKLTISISESPRIVQPEPFTDGVTAVEEASTIAVEQASSRVALMEGAASLNEIVDALNMLGVGAADLVVILESLKQAGALQAEMVVI
jgi:flagellar P-ring protein precursor FlgI